MRGVFFLLLALAAIFGGIREKILSDLSRGDLPLSIG
jgi:hypothetical protein